MTTHYSFNIEWNEEEQEFVATCPAFPGLSAFGKTEEDALAEAKLALGGFIETCREQSIPLPEPQVYESYSGQFRVRLPKSLHRKAAQLAGMDGVSLNQIVISAVEQRVGAKQVGTRMLAEIKQALAEHSNQFKVVLASALTSNQRLMIPQGQVISEISSLTMTRKVVTGRVESTKGN